MARTKENLRAAADTGSKWLIGHSPEAWVQWVLQDLTLQVEAQLATEFPLGFSESANQQ